MKFQIKILPPDWVRIAVLESTMANDGNLANSSFDKVWRVKCCRLAAEFDDGIPSQQRKDRLHTSCGSLLTIYSAVGVGRSKDCINNTI